MNQMSIFDIISEPCDYSDKPLRLIELFAGYGSQAMALERLNIDFEHYRVVEFDKFAIQSYNAVHGTNFPTMDIRDVHGPDLGIVDKDKYYYFLTYSFPCTDLSVAGNMEGMEEGSGTRSALLWEVKRILNECNELPDILMMENVPQVISEANKDAFSKWTDFLESKGYHSFGQILNAKDYGIPQNRERFFMFSFLKDVSYHFPEPMELKITAEDLLEETVDEKYYMNSDRANKLVMEVIDRQTDRQTDIPR